VHCNTVQVIIQSPLLSAALQDTLTAGFDHCNDTYEDLLFIQVCSDPTPVQCNTVVGKMLHPVLTAAQQHRLTAGTVSMHLHLWRFAVHTGVQ